MTQAIDNPGHDPTTPDGDVNPIDTDYTAGQDNIVMNLGPFGLDIHNKVFAISALLIIVFVALTMTFQTQAEPIEMPMIDTMELEARLYRNQPIPSWWDRWYHNKTVKPVSIRLADSRARYGLPFYKPHQAVTDALATAELLQAQVAHRYSAHSALDNFWR